MDAQERICLPSTLGKCWYDHTIIIMGPMNSLFVTQAIYTH